MSDNRTSTTAPAAGTGARPTTDTAVTGKQWGHMRLVDDREAQKGRRYTLDITIWASNGKTLARRIKRFTDAIVKSQLGGGHDA